MLQYFIAYIVDDDDILENDFASSINLWGELSFFGLENVGSLMPNRLEKS